MMCDFIKMSKDEIPHEEFCSVYNLIEHLQCVLLRDKKPELTFIGDNTIAFIVDGVQYDLQTDNVKDVLRFEKWINSFLYHDEKVSK